MSSFNDNYRFFSFISLGILVLFLSTTTDVFANEAEEVLATNKRVWSVIKSQNSLIEGKVKINETSKPKNKKLHSQPQTAKAKKSIRRDSRFWSIVKTQSKLIDGLVKIKKSSNSVEKVKASKPKKEQPHSPPQTAKAKESLSRESRRSYATNSKGSTTSFLDNPNAVKPFCNINATTAFCIRHGESHHKYTGNTPRRHPRLLDYRDVNSKNRKHESKDFFQQLVRQSNR